MSETAKAFSPQEVFPRVPEETLTKLQSLQPRWQNLPAGYGQVDREMGRGTLSFRATFASCGPYGEYRAVAIHSPAIAILNIFFFPASTLIYPVFAMEFVAIGQRGVVAVIDCKGSPGEKLAQSQAKSILLASHERFPHLLNGDDPPAWYEEARSGDDFFLRPEKPDVFSDLLDCHYFVWDRYTRNLIKASPTPAPISDSHSAFVADYKQHHAENSPGRPFLQKVFGSDWCETFLSQHLFA